jgi:DNA polymerase-4
VRRHYLAAIYLDVRGEPADDWLAACSRVSAAVERVSARAALLDLGTCADTEAYTLVFDHLQRLSAMHLNAHAGIAHNLALAQLAGLCVPSHTPHAPLALITPTAVPAFLPTVPVALLAHLHPWGRVTSVTVERLHRYGLHTLGHIARLSEQSLRRQFGATGAFLATLTQGRDTYHLHPTPLPTRAHFRLRLASAASTERILALLPRLTAYAATYLRGRGHMARELRLCVRWERGGMSAIQRTLRTHIHDPAHLTQEARQLITTLLGEHAFVSAIADDAIADDAIAELRLTLCDFAPLVPTQATFWRTRDQRLAAAHLASETLARRHGRPLLLSVCRALPDAILAHSRYCLTPLGDADSVDNPTVSRVSSIGSPPARIWQDVPLHRHWW